MKTVPRAASWTAPADPARAGPAGFLVGPPGSPSLCGKTIWTEQALPPAGESGRVVTLVRRNG
ncbi:hypothetical protein ACGFMM_00390 [Streptomyces sp. NPDC048604]|uniref:hypothetical protein n=1 Tax=Streptomyces sp. NPDC048604 TaxID=3365578 RepID=UPI0037201257